MLLYNQGHYDEAEPLLRRALTISEQVFGPDHPNTIATREALEKLKEASKE